MKIHWPQYHFSLVLTEDQSPSLRLLNSESAEAMHHSGGAYSETQKIYGEPLRQALCEGCRSVLSVGLGLGYNEILVAFEAMKQGLSPVEFDLLSFESEEILKTHFLAWIQSEEEDFIYDQIFSFFQNSPELPGITKPSKHDVKEWLKDALSSGHWELRGALNSQFKVSRRYEVIFYDAFSSKTNPELWNEEFLENFFRNVAAKSSHIASYACTGSLKRALKKTGFQLRHREGFCGKRNSTWAMSSSG